MGENFPADEHSMWPQANTSTAHVWRYLVARGFIEPQDIINDVSCGYGYGSNILARSTATLVRGYDYSQDTLDDAVKNFGGSFSVGADITFDYADLDSDIQLPECDMAVSIETIEHLNDPVRFAKMLMNTTKRIIFITAPVMPTTQKALGEEKGSPWHHHDFSLVSLENLFINDKWKVFNSFQCGMSGYVIAKRI